MSGVRIEVKFQCRKCGGTVIELPDNYNDMSIAACKKCGAEFGEWGEIKKDAKDLMMGHVQEKFREAFKGLKGWKLK